MILKHDLLKVGLMRAIFFSYLNAYGHIMPTISIMRELVELGCILRIYTGDEIKDIFNKVSADIQLYPCYSNIFTEEIEYSDFFKKWYSSLSASVIMRRYLFQVLRESVIEFAPDFIIYDQAASWGQDYSEFLQIPNICLITGYAFSNDILERDGDIIQMEYLGMKGMSHEDRLTEIRKLNRSLQMNHSIYGCNELCLEDFFLRSGQLNIVLYLREFQMRVDSFDNSFQFLGQWYGKEEMNYDDSITQFMKGKKCIYVSLGSDHNQNIEFYKSLLHFSENCQYAFIISAGTENQEDAIRKLIPANKKDSVYLSRFVPQLQVLENAVMFITHGGTSSVMQAVQFKIPMLVVPQQIDEFLIARQIKILHIGDSLYDDEFKSISQLQFCHIVDKLIHCPVIRENLMFLHDKSITTHEINPSSKHILSFVEQSGN